MNPLWFVHIYVTCWSEPHIYIYKDVSAVSTSPPFKRCVYCSFDYMANSCRSKRCCNLLDQAPKGSTSWVEALLNYQETFLFACHNYSVLDHDQPHDPHSFRSWYGCFLKWWYPQNTTKWSFLAGKPMVVGETHHFRKPPYACWPSSSTINGCTFLGSTCDGWSHRSTHGSP